MEIKQQQKKEEERKHNSKWGYQIERRTLVYKLNRFSHDIYKYDRIKSP